MAEGMKQKHFVLVHGSNHGAWAWYKLKPLLEAAGNRVTVMDLIAAGINMTAIQDVYTLYEHTKPLLDILSTLPSDEKVVLVGHSSGGLNLALASDMFPDKISVAVFLTAFMPDTAHQPSYVLDEYNKKTPAEAWLDTQFNPYDNSDPNSPTSMAFGPKFLTFKLYQLCPIEVLELAKVLVRPGSLFLHELSKAKPFSEEGYGHVTRAFIVCEEDQAITKEFQYLMIDNFHVHHVMKIKGADHMAMLSKTQEVFECLSDISNFCA